MPVTEQTPVVTYNGNGVTTVFAYNFKILAAADMEVTVDGVVKTLTTHYSVSGVGSDGGGNVTMVTAPASGTANVVLRRAMAYNRTTDYQDNGDLLAATADEDADRPIMMIQQLVADLFRAIKLPVGTTENQVIGSATERANQMIGFDANGDMIMYTLGTELANLNFLQAGAGAVSRTYQNKLRESVSVKDFGAAGDGATDDTAAITAALATGKSVYFPPGTYMTTGGHALTYPSNQRIFGHAFGASIIKRASGTATLFDIGQQTQCVFDSLSFHGNNLGGRIFMWRAHYSEMKNIWIQDVAGTSYAIHVSGSNLCTYNDVHMFNVNGGWLIDQSSDPLASKPTYGCLYSTWNHCDVDIRAAGAGNALGIAGSINGALTFNDFYFELVGAATTGLGISIGGTNTYAINFNQLSCEVIDTGAQIIEVTPGVVYDVRFNNSKFGVSAARANPFFSVNACHGFELSGCYFTDLFSAAPTFMTLTDSKNVVVKNNTLSCLNNFTFINDVSGNSYVSTKNNVTRTYAGGPGVGTNTWDATATNLLVEPDEMTQSFASDYYAPIRHKSTGKPAGTATNDAAAAGEIGEYIESVVGSTSAPTTNQYGDLTSITLTAGDWDVSVIVSYAINGATTTYAQAGIGTASGNNSAGLVAGDTYAEIQPQAANQPAVIPSKRKSLAGTTTLYLKMYATYSAGTPKFFGRISARRVR